LPQTILPLNSIKQLAERKVKLYQPQDEEAKEEASPHIGGYHLKFAKKKLQ